MVGTSAMTLQFTKAIACRWPFLLPHSVQEFTQCLPFPLSLQDTFVELYGNNAAAESRKGQERFNRWFLTGMTVAGVVLLGSLFSRK